MTMLFGGMVYQYLNGSDHFHSITYYLDDKITMLEHSLAIVASFEIFGIILKKDVNMRFCSQNTTKLTTHTS